MNVAIINNKINLNNSWPSKKITYKTASCAEKTMAKKRPPHGKKDDQETAN